MRKSVTGSIWRRNIEDLQCGRIYKDAEICSRAKKRNTSSATLQCGRIYKDAEIDANDATDTKPRIYLQCGRIYKDAEIRP